jgi:hypothetical protein
VRGSAGYSAGAISRRRLDVVEYEYEYEYEYENDGPLPPAPCLLPPAP